MLTTSKLFSARTMSQQRTILGGVWSYVRSHFNALQLALNTNFCNWRKCLSFSLKQYAPNISPIYAEYLCWDLLRALALKRITSSLHDYFEAQKQLNIVKILLDSGGNQQKLQFEAFRVFQNIFSCRLAGKLWSSILLLLFLFFFSFKDAYPHTSYVCEWHNFFDQSYMFDLVQTFSNFSQHNQTCSKFLKLVQTCSKLLYFVQTGSNMLKLVQTSLHFIQLVQTCPNT